MKPADHGSRRTRIILVYILGVVIPGVVLGFMAYRGIRSDDALREKQVRQELNLVAQDFFQLFNKDISDWSIDTTFSPLVLNRDTNIRIVKDKLLFLPEKFLPNKGLSLIGVEPDRGWELEFLENDLDGARNYLLKMIAGNDKAPPAVNARMSLARILRKQGKPTEALNEYQNILLLNPKENNRQLPVNLTARLEMVKIFESLNATDKVAAGLEDIAVDLLHPGSDYNFQTFDLFYSELRNQKAKFPKADSLFILLDQAILRTNHLNKFLMMADEYLAYPGNQLVYLPKNGYRDILVTQKVESGGIRAAMVDLNQMIENRFSRLINEVDPAKHYSWQVKDESGIVRSIDVNIGVASFLSFPFPNPLPGWQIEMQINPKPFFSALFESGKGLYAGIFGLLAIWLILGLIFTIYLLSQELRLSRMKTNFISNVSHEFKSPVTSIRHMSELLRLRRVRTEEKKDEFYDSMIEQCDHLSHLIENILDFSKIEDDIRKYHFEKIDPTDLIKNLVDIHRNRLSESGLDFNFSVTGPIPMIMADQDALRQVIYNLLDNAGKYGADGKNIDINMSATDKEVCIEVKDYGRGIAVADQQKIFERFYRVEDSKNEGIKGSGIGLTLVKNMVESHHGRIVLISNPGNGSSFYVYLPIDQSLVK